MQWDSSENAGFTEGKPWLPVSDDYQTVNVKSEMSDQGSVLNWYIALAKLRREHRELIEGDYDEILHEDEQIFAYIRENDEKKAIVLINMSEKNATYDPSVVENAKQIIGTDGESKKGELAPLEAVIYEEDK
jgi:alpha-glucosidase